MIAIVQPLIAGNALRLFIEPPAGAVHWRVLRKGSDAFAGESDPTALVVYEGNEHVIVDTISLKNDVMAFYRPFYSPDGVAWVAGATVTGTPASTYEEQTTDVLSFMRDRLEAGLKVEVERGNLIASLGYIQVYTASPTLERDQQMPLVTVHLENEEPDTRFLGEDMGDIKDVMSGDWDESEGWFASVRLTIIGWSLNGDERIELRKALRRIIIANLPIFADKGWLQPEFGVQDVDAVSGEYPAPIFQVMGSFSCVAPVRVSGVADSVREVILRSING
jgi:hypothetical protein